MPYLVVYSHFCQQYFKVFYEALKVEPRRKFLVRVIIENDEGLSARG